MKRLLTVCIEVIGSLPENRSWTVSEIQLVIRRWVDLLKFGSASVSSFKFKVIHPVPLLDYVCCNTVICVTYTSVNISAKRKKVIIAIIQQNVCHLFLRLGTVIKDLIMMVRAGSGMTYYQMYNLRNNKTQCAIDLALHGAHCYGPCSQFCRGGRGRRLCNFTVNMILACKNNKANRQISKINLF